MIATTARYARIWLASIRYSLVRAMMFRGDFIMWALVEFFWMAANILLVNVIYDHTDSIAGWTKYEMLLLVGTTQLTQRLLGEVFGEKPEVSLDVAHGSHKAEHDAQLRLGAARERIERVMTGMAGRRPEQDADGDYVVPASDVHVMVAPRVAAGGPVVVRVFAITNVGVSVTPELGLFLARLNFGLMFGRFALDAEHRSIWFDETLLGDQFSDEELRFAIQVVSATADEWDDRMKQMFGGATYQEVLTSGANHELPRVKPGEGGYL